MPFPVLEDVMNDLKLLSSELRNLYIPDDLDIMIEHWILLIRISRMLGEILALFYQQLAHTPTLLQFENLESELGSVIISAPHGAHSSRLSMFSYLHLQLHYQYVALPLFNMRRIC